MAVAFRGKSLVNTGVSSTQTVLPVPAGVQQGDKMYALVGSVVTTPTITPPAGWTLITEYNPGTFVKSALYSRVVGATAEPASYTWAWSSSGRTIGMCVAYAGLDLTAAESGGAVDASDTAGPTGTYSFALANEGDWMFVATFGRENPGTELAKTWTINDTSDVERHDTYSTNTGTGAKVTAAWWDSGRSMPPGTVARQVTVSQTLSQYHVWAIRLAAPASGGGINALPTDVNTWTQLGQPQR